MDLCTRNFCWLFVTCLLFVGCGGDDVAPTPEDTGDNVRFEQPAPGTENNTDDGPCTGCLDDDDACQSGDDVTACGDGGSTCMECVGDEQCVDGECSMPMTESCGPDNCDGCCTAEGACVSGGGSDACGLGGEACTACATGEDCNAGVCEDDTPQMQVCGPDNCAGCCDGSGACVAGTGADACGAGGGACSDCAASGAACNAGVCEAPQPTCAMTCQGCCVGETCIMATDDTQCGTGGASCMACGADEMCSAGSCVANPPSDRWQVVIVSAAIPATKPNGSSWDPAGGYPDVVTGLYTEDTTLGVYWENYTSVAVDELNPVWNEVIIADVTDEALANGLLFYLYDDEFAVDDICLQLEVVDPFTVNPGQDIVSTCEDDVLVDWTWRIERYTP